MPFMSLVPRFPASVHEFYFNVSNSHLWCYLLSINNIRLCEEKKKRSHYFHTISLYFRTIGTEISKNDAQNHSVFDIFTPNDAEKKKKMV